MMRNGEREGKNVIPKGRSEDPLEIIQKVERRLKERKSNHSS